MNIQPLYLNGEWTVSEPAIDVVNPADGEVFARMSTTGRAGIKKAIDDAQAAFGAWRSLAGMQRADYLHAIAAELTKRGDEVAKTITLENGKPLAQAKGELGMALDHLRWFAEEARRGYGRVIPHQAPGKRHFTIKTPIGVVAAIAPWNFPLVLAVRKVAAAMAAGCPVILKPASATPLNAVAFAECVEAAGVPKGVFQLVAGSASEIGAEFMENPLCRKITFTGSTEVGKILIEGAAPHIKPLSLELGGHSPVLVFDDADLDQAVEGTMIAKFRNTGQSCIAANRIYVQKGIYEKFLEKLVAQTKALKVGNGLEEGIDIGALVDKAGLDKAVAHVEDAVAKGATLHCGGKAVANSPGLFFEPAVLTGVPGDAETMCDESFAPIANVNVFETEEEAVALANNTRYGLSAYLFTKDLGRTFRLMEVLEAGMIAVNDGVPTTSQAPFGGVKQSGWGRELGIEGMEAFLEQKHVCLRID